MRCCGFTSILSTSCSPSSLPRINSPCRNARDVAGISLGAAYIEIEVEDGRLVLTPAWIGSADGVRRKLAELGILKQMSPML
jgi:hypothetical protein